VKRFLTRLPDYGLSLNVTLFGLAFGLSILSYSPADKMLDFFHFAIGRFWPRRLFGFRLSRTCQGSYEFSVYFWDRVHAERWGGRRPKLPEPKQQFKRRGK
jgi:hypothetical protein